MAKPQKVEAVQHLIDQMRESEMIVIADYRGLSVAEMARLRRQMSDSQTRLEVAKNTLVKRAAREVGMDEQFDAFLEGPTAVAFVQAADVAAPAKTISDYAKASKTFTVKGGALGTRVLTVDQIQQLADLPSREVLIARVVGGMQAPISGLVTVLGGTIRSLMYALKARSEQLEAQ